MWSGGEKLKHKNAVLHGQFGASGGAVPSRFDGGPTRAGEPKGGQVTAGEGWGGHRDIAAEKKQIGKGFGTCRKSIKKPKHESKLIPASTGSSQCGGKTVPMRIQIKTADVGKYQRHSRHRSEITALPADGHPLNK